MGQSDLHQYQRLWHEVFGDDWDFIADLFAEVGKGHLLPIGITSGSTLIGAAMLVPYKLCLQQGPATSYYIYGVLTHPEHRNQGVCTRLLQRAHAQALIDGKDYCFLSPASEALEQFYMRRGYTAACRAGATVPIGSCDMAGYNAALQAPCIQHSDADWHITRKYFYDGLSLPCQFFSIGQKPAPNALLTAGIFR